MTMQADVAAPPLGAPRRPQPTPLTTLLAELDAIVDRITASDPYEQDGAAAAEASRRVNAATGRLHAQRLGWVARVEADGLWALDTIRSFASWLSWRENLPHAVARRTVHEARTLRDALPRTALRARSGDVTIDQARTLVTHAATSDARRAALRAPVPEPVGPVGAATDSHEARMSADDARTGEEVLLDLAATCSHGQLVRTAKHFALLTDSDACERGYRDAAEREFFELSATLGGFHVAGFLTEEHGQIVRTAMQSVIGVPSAGDPLTGPQRRAVALTGIARTVLDHGLGSAGASVRPHLNVLVSWSELEHCLRRTGGTGPARASSEQGPSPSAEGPGRPGADSEAGSDRAALPGVPSERAPFLGTDHPGRPGPDRPATPGVSSETGSDLTDLAAILAAGPATWQDGTGPVPPSVLRRIAADGELTRIVFGPASQVIDVGRAQRTFTGARRKAVIARDRHCVWPDCTAPPEIGQIHHAVTHWADGGGTDTDNAALLCWFHHQHVDSRGIAMRRTADGWEFGAPGSYRTNGFPHAHATTHSSVAPPAPPAAVPASVPASAPPPHSAPPALGTRPVPHSAPPPPATTPVPHSAPPPPATTPAAHGDPPRTHATVPEPSAA